MGKGKKAGDAGVFTHPEWALRGKRPRLKLFLACGKVLPEDATNLRIIDGNPVISQLNHCLDIGGFLPEVKGLYSRGRAFHSVTTRENFPLVFFACSAAIPSRIGPTAKRSMCKLISLIRLHRPSSRGIS